MKTASLIANSCEAIAILNNSDPVQIEAARDFGKHIGLAFQIQDDRLDFIADAEQLGKVRFVRKVHPRSTSDLYYFKPKMSIKYDLVKFDDFNHKSHTSNNQC